MPETKRAPGRPRTGNAAVTMNMSPEVRERLKEWTAESGLAACMGDSIKVLMAGAEARIRRMIADGHLSMYALGAPLVTTDLLRRLDAGEIGPDDFQAQAQGYGIAAMLDDGRLPGIPPCAAEDVTTAWEMTDDARRADSLRRQQELLDRLPATGEGDE